jgi:hypothetical protein
MRNFHIVYMDTLNDQVRMFVFCYLALCVILFQLTSKFGFP